MSETCDECVRLWKEYESGVRAHIEIVGQYQIAMIQQDGSALARLQALLREAAERRANAREAVKRYEARS